MLEHTKYRPEKQKILIWFFKFTYRSIQLSLVYILNKLKYTKNSRNGILIVKLIYF